MNIYLLLNKYIDLDYKTFQEKICPTKYEILGIKIPVLRKIAKMLLKEYDYKYLLNNINNDYFEYIVLKCLIIGYVNVCYDERINLINDFLPLIDNWAVCDIFVSNLKFIKENKEKFLNYLTTIKEKKEFYQRFIYVVFLNYYIEEEYLPLIFNKTIENDVNDYYTLMGISWCISICLTKYFAKTITFLKNNKDNINKFIYNKSIQKGIESYKLTNEQKCILRTLK